MRGTSSTIIDDGAEGLRRALGGIPRGSLLLIIAGSPCQDLTFAGHSAGALGVCGPSSILFWAIPLIARLAQSIRNDLLIH
eukprot:4020233-Alexandrium_andersonii.AAC.1